MIQHLLATKISGYTEPRCIPSIILQSKLFICAFIYSKILLKDEQTDKLIIIDYYKLPTFWRSPNQYYHDYVETLVIGIFQRWSCYLSLVNPELNVYMLHYALTPSK